MRFENTRQIKYSKEVIVIGINHIFGILVSVALFGFIFSDTVDPQIDKISMDNQLAQMMGRVCYTQYIACVLPGFGPIGSPCWCATPAGPAGGRIGN